MRLYLDTAPLIYAVEQVLPYAASVDARLSVAGTVPVISDLTRLECRVKPMRKHDTALLADYEMFLTQVVTSIIPLTREVIDQATELRAHYGLKTPDAIHVAAALTSRCDVFLTNDHRLGRVAGMRIEIIEALGR